MTGSLARLSAAAASLAAVCAIGVLSGATPARADTLDSRVLVLRTEGQVPPTLPGLSEELARGLVRSAKRMTKSVARAKVTLRDTAGVVGCEPSARDCLDAVAAALNVDQLIVVHLTPAADGVEVELTVVTREVAPVSRRFVVHPPSRRADLAAIEAAVPDMLEAGEARGVPTDQPPRDEPPPPHDATPPGGPAPTEVTAPVTQAPASRGPFVVAAAGGAAVLAGATFWLLARSVQSDIDAAPTRTAADLDHLADLEDRGRRDATIGNVLAIGGILAVAAGAAWWWHDRRDDVVVAPAVGASGGGVTLGGRW